MIYYTIPFDDTKNIGKYYNSFMEKLGKDDWACFLDGDAMFLNSFFGLKLQEYIDKYPECGIFTALTNRIGNQMQQFGDWHSDDIIEHRRVAAEQMEKNTVKDLNSGIDHMSGVLILLNKKTWKKLGGFKESGMLGVDTDFSMKARKAKEPIYIMEGVYVYHWYRGGDRTYKKHLL